MLLLVKCCLYYFPRTENTFYKLKVCYLGVGRWGCYRDHMDIWWAVAIDGLTQVPSVWGLVLVLVNPENAGMVDDGEGAKRFQKIYRLDLIATKGSTTRPCYEI